MSGVLSYVLCGVRCNQTPRPPLSLSSLSLTHKPLPAFLSLPPRPDKAHFSILPRPVFPMAATTITSGAIGKMFRGVTVKDPVVQLIAMNPSVGTDGAPKRIK